VRGNCLACGDPSPWWSWLPLNKRKWTSWLSVPFKRQGLITCCTVAWARVVDYARAYTKVCQLYLITRHVASTEGRSMTNGANYNRHKLDHSPWHSDIRTPSQLNTHQHIIDTQPPPPGESGSNTARLAGTTSNTEVLCTQQERRYNLVRRDTANAATKYLTQDAHLKIVRKTGSRKNIKQLALGCEYNHIEPISGQLTV